LAHIRIDVVLQLCLLPVCALAADAPPPEAFRVLPAASAEKPEITPYLKYQTEMAWHEDDLRRAAWEGIGTEQELLKFQRELRKRLLDMIGGLPADKTPLNAHTTGRIQMQGFRIEKLIFESLPGIYVSALVYAPDAAGKYPAVLVPSGHSTNGKAYYQALCQRLVQRGYVVISWDAFGQGERSQFWDAKNHKSRYNLICAEHAILGNLAYLAGTNLARWEIWDGIRAVDYLLTRPDVDPERINITGTSGGGFQTTLIAALDPRIKVVAPSCYITVLPMRVYNRIFKDPDSDPEQDLDGMISNGLDHPGLLLLMYPRPVFVSAAVLDFFPIEGTEQTVHEVERIYEKFGHADRIGMHAGYHGHQFSDENQEAAIDFLDHFNGMPMRRGLPEAKKLDDQSLQCTRTGQVMIEYPNARSLLDVIRDYFEEHKNRPAITLKQLYYSNDYPGIHSWQVGDYKGAIPRHDEILWEQMGTTTSDGVSIDRYLLHHSRYLAMPLLHIQKTSSDHRHVLLWLGENGKASASDWPNLTKYLDAGYDILSMDPRGLGETRMPYKAASPDDPTLSQMDFDRAYNSQISGVLADYVYNSVLTGRPYLLQMIEDVEIAMRFADQKMNVAKYTVIGTGDAYTFSSAVAETFSNIKLLTEPDAHVVKWSDLVEQKQELWPIQYLLPGGAYIH
jgi:cephalosporin-C deacetylase-like acetyl esterase